MHGTFKHMTWACPNLDTGSLTHGFAQHGQQHGQQHVEHHVKHWQTYIQRGRRKRPLLCGDGTKCLT